MTSTSYDPNLIIQAANDKQANNDFPGAQMIFQSALLDWVDDAREGTSPLDAESMQMAVSTLWIAYAHFLVSNKQFKSATEAYEQAVVCPVAGTVGRVWLDYARFVEDRGKLKSAQDVYIRALQKVTDEQDQALLWQEFLEMMQKSNPTLTLEDLKTAVQGSTTAVPEPVPSAAAVAPADTGTDSPPMKRLKREEDHDSSSPVPPPVASSAEESRTHVVTAEAVNVESQAFTDSLSTAENGLPPDLAAAWMMRDGNGPAQPPEPPLFEPSPPKLSDPTAKDILGVNLALSLVERILSPSGTLVLDVCQGLWALHAMKEQKSRQAVEMLDQTMKEEMEKMESVLEGRASAVAGAAASNVQHMNDNARREFQTTCGQQRQNLLSGIAWEFRQLLAIQQQVLTKMKVPGFDGATVDPGTLELQARICSYLHSAFFLRSRVGEGPHSNMLEGHLKLLRKEQERPEGSLTPPIPAYQVPLQQQMPQASLQGYGQQQQMMQPQQYVGYQGHPQAAPQPGSYPNQQYPPYY